MSKTSLLHTLLNGGLSFLPHIIFLCNKLKGNIQDLLDENGTDPLSFTAQQNQYILMEVSLNRIIACIHLTPVLYYKLQALISDHEYIYGLHV